MEHIVQVVQVGYQVLPERHLSGAVVVSHSGLQANVQIQLVLRVVLRPGDFLKAVGLRVDELGVLRDGLIRISAGKEERYNSISVFKLQHNQKFGTFHLQRYTI